ncbi:MAG: ribulose-phosphate 3-epimerase [Puniceicoccales bacterium]|jgi:ribulose-phosphate 3-epimerase|nr:ribulose-phosphate 3-epimerase [Puniceicoccales bacterium]
MNEKILAPSILAYDNCRIGEGIKIIESFPAKWIHVDIMDGVFVPGITFGQNTVAAMRKLTKLWLDVHLMVQNPEFLAQSFIDAGADMLTFHCESSGNAEKTIDSLKSLGRPVGIAINPETPILAIEKCIERVDLVLVMGVNPGKCGQEFLPSTIGKIEQLHALRKNFGLRFKISIDGGMNQKTLQIAGNAGADIFVSGRAFFENPQLLRPYFSRSSEA